MTGLESPKSQINTKGNDMANGTENTGADPALTAVAGSPFAMSNKELQEAIGKTREMEKGCCKNATKEKLSAHLYDLLEIQKCRAAIDSLPFISENTKDVDASRPTTSTQ